MIKRCAAVAVGLTTLAFADVASSAPPILPGGKWAYDVRQDPLDDSKVIMLLLRSSPEGSGGALVFKCQKGSARMDALGAGGKISVMLSTDDVLRTPAEDLVTYRFDADPALQQKWYYDLQLVTSVSGGPAFASYAAASKRLAMRVTNHRGNELTYLFDLTGSAKAIARLKEDCAT